MVENAKLFSLKGSEYYITEQEKDAFRVREGHILVYVVPIRKEGPGRRSFIYEATEGEVIPGFVYQDAEHSNWRFCFTALEHAVIEHIENGSTAILRERFSKKAKIKNYGVEGFCGGLVDQYQMNVVREDGFIRRSQKEREDVAEKVNQLIADAIQKNGSSWEEKDFQKTRVQNGCGETRSKTGIWKILLLCGITVCRIALVLLTSHIVCLLFSGNFGEWSRDFFLKQGIFLAIIAVLAAVLLFIKNFVMDEIRQRIVAEVQDKVYKTLFKHPESFFRKYSSSDLAMRILGAGTMVGDMEAIKLRLVTAGIAVVALAAGMAWYAIGPAVVAWGFGLIYVLYCRKTDTYLLQCEKEANEMETRTESLLFQFMNGIIGLRTSAMEDRAVYEYMKPYVELQEIKSQKRKLLWGKNALSGLIIGVSVVVISAVYVKTRTILPGNMAAFLVVYGYFLAILHEMVSCLSKYGKQKRKIVNVKAILEKIPVTEEMAEQTKPLSGLIEVRQVRFSYSPEQPDVLHNVNLFIRPGEYVGLVGPSGCGKTTLLRLLLGLEQPDSGTVLYDGTDINPVNRQQLRSTMGVVLQEDKLISGSIYENITLTCPEASMEQVSQAIKAVGLEEEIEKLPMGIYTLLNEDCRVISAGQYQQILLARALLSKPSLLFLDEATASLDTVSQRKICEMLKTYPATKIVAAHRLNTVRDCDRIIVLEEGSVVEQGTYEELMKERGLFYQLAEKQIISERV